MTESEQRIADDVVNRLTPLLVNDQTRCEMMHRGLVNEFKQEQKQGREDFIEEMGNIRLILKRG